MKSETVNLKPTRNHARKILELLNHGLTQGKGEPKPGAMCVEAAVCFAMGLPHSDEPPCVGSAVRSFKITLNDCDWSTDAAMAKGLRRLAIAQLGSDTIDQNLFVKELALATVRRIVPLALRAAAGMKGNESHKQALLDHASKCEAVGDLNAARNASYAASDASDEVLSLMADAGVNALVVCKSLGCKWLHLCEITTHATQDTGGDK